MSYGDGRVEQAEELPESEASHDEGSQRSDESAYEPEPTANEFTVASSDPLADEWDQGTPVY